MNSEKNFNGKYGRFGGRFVPETLIPALIELDDAYRKAVNSSEFKKELNMYLKDFCGRPTPLYYAERLTRHLSGGKIYLKREDLNHMGAHKINNTLGQILLARSMGKERIIAETGAGQHGVATAVASAIFNLKCEIYMGEEDIKRQKLNVFRMELLGAEIHPVSSGEKTLKDAVNEAIRDWVANVDDTHYIIGSVVGPHPYPRIVRDFQAVIGRETREEILKKEGVLPDYLIACIGGGSNAAGLFHPFRNDENVKFIGVEAGGCGLKSGKHAATLSRGRVGILHGSKSYMLQDKEGQVLPAHSISAGLDYPGVGPEHSYYKESGRAEYFSVTDQEALDAFSLLSKMEGIVPALESAHAVAYACKFVPDISSEEIVVINISGRGDKDVYTAADFLNVEIE